MSSNVIDIFSKTAKEEPVDAVKEFMLSIVDWAHRNGIDVTSIDFKYDGAAIMTILQGMLQRAE